MFAIGLKSAFRVEVALRDHPLAEPIAVYRVRHPDAAVADTRPDDLLDREKALQTARDLSDRARDKLYSAAHDHAYFLGEVEKLVLKMNQETAEKVRNGSEA
jgi:hypothetical protein